MRYIIYGAGAVGGVIGSALHAIGKEVLLITRGAHLEAIKSKGLTLETLHGSETFSIPAVGSVHEARIDECDCVVLTMKSQDTEEALRDLVGSASRNIRIYCAQNGVENERLALRRFRSVHAILTLLPATLIEPGVIQHIAEPKKGVLDVGRYPAGADNDAYAFSTDLSKAGFSSRCMDDIMPWKYGKLVQNAFTAVGAMCKPGRACQALSNAIAAEAEECLRRAGVSWISQPELSKRRTSAFTVSSTIGTHALGRSSLWQSLDRKAGTVETAYYNGEIALIGRLSGAECFLNTAVMEVSDKMARDGARPGSLDPEIVFACAEALRAEAADRSSVHEALTTK